MVSDPEIDELLTALAELDNKIASAFRQDLATGNVDQPKLKRLLREMIWRRRNKDSPDAPTIPRWKK